MSYTLQAFIEDESDVRSAAPSGASVIRLLQSKALVPFTKSVREAHDISFLPLTNEGADDAPDAVHKCAARAKKIAYVEAEFFGSAGMQAAAVWEGGRLVFGPVIANDAINQALRILGVSKEEHSDEFEALSLGRHRDTDQWK